MQTRPYDWFDEKKHRVMFGLEVKHLGRWMTLGVNGRPLLFETEKERDEERASWRRVKSPRLVANDSSADCQGEG